MHARATTIKMYATEMKILGALGALLVLLGMLYFYFLTMSIMHVVAREEMLIEIAATHSRIGSLETEYLVKKESISEEIAIAEGYVALGNKHYVLSEQLNRRNLTLNQ
jgi:hypothetical protein